MTTRRVKWGVLHPEHSNCEWLTSDFDASSSAELAQQESERYDKVVHDPNVEAIYIRVPCNKRLEWILKAANAKKHILCEKPAVLHAQEASQIMVACQENGVLFMESCPHLFHPQHDKAKQLIQDGFIGDVKMIKSSCSFPEVEGECEPGAGVLYNLVGDCMNTIRYIFQREPLSVTAVGHGGRAEFDKTIGLLLNYPDHKYALVDCSSEMAMRNEYEVVGTKGVIKLPFAYRPDLNGGDGLILMETENSKTELTIKHDRNSGLIEHLSRCILQGTISEYSGEYLWKNAKILDAVSQALKTGSSRARVENKLIANDGWDSECGITSFLKSGMH